MDEENFHVVENATTLNLRDSFELANTSADALSAWNNLVVDQVFEGNELPEYTRSQLESLAPTLSRFAEFARSEQLLPLIYVGFDNDMDIVLNEIASSNGGIFEPIYFYNQYSGKFWILLPDGRRLFYVSNQSNYDFEVFQECSTDEEWLETKKALDDIELYPDRPSRNSIFFKLIIPHGDTKREIVVNINALQGETEQLVAIHDYISGEDFPGKVYEFVVKSDRADEDIL